MTHLLCGLAGGKMVIALEVPAHIPHTVVSVIEGSIFSSGRVQPDLHC